MYVEGTYLAYLIVSITITVWVAATLHKHGRIFLVDAFLGNEALADSVNKLLVVGFYLVNVGFVSLAMKYGDAPGDMRTSLEYLSTKVGLVLVILGVMHFFNILVFSRMRRRALDGPRPRGTSGFATAAPSSATPPPAGQWKGGAW